MVAIDALRAGGISAMTRIPLRGEGTQDTNLIMVYSPDRQRLLMCRRDQEPLPGAGQPARQLAIERGRRDWAPPLPGELAEETGITPDGYRP